MAWPENTDYNEAIQNPQLNFADPELKQGKVVVNALGMPVVRAGNFADVYEVQCPSGNSYAVKCFTREIKDLQQRYQAISDHLNQAKLPFTVDFQYLGKGILIKGNWFPILKMRWVEGLTLNQFAQDHVDKPQILERLAQMWVKLAQLLRKANMAHADLQHGNVLLISGKTTGSLGLRLIDYDGMFVPALAKHKSGEVGHPNFQHPERIATGIYNTEVDRFSHLVIYTALRCLAVGGKKLWQDYDNGDNLLFREADLRAPGSSAVFQELWESKDPTVHALAGRLLLACQSAFDEVPYLDDVLTNGKPAELPPDQAKVVTKVLKAGSTKVQKPATATPPMAAYELQPLVITPSAPSVAGWLPSASPGRPAPPAAALPPKPRLPQRIGAAFREVNGQAFQSVLLGFPARILEGIRRQAFGRALLGACVGLTVVLFLAGIVAAFYTAGSLLGGALVILGVLGILGGFFGALEGSHAEGPGGGIPGFLLGLLMGAVLASSLAIPVAALGDYSVKHTVAPMSGLLAAGALLGFLFGLVLAHVPGKTLWKTGGLAWVACFILLLPGFAAIGPQLLEQAENAAPTPDPNPVTAGLDKKSVAKPVDLQEDAGDVRALAFAPDGKHLLTVNARGSLQCWDLSDRRRIWEHQLIQDGKATPVVSFIAMTPDSRIACVGLGSTLVQLSGSSGDLFDPKATRQERREKVNAPGLVAGRFVKQGNRTEFIFAQSSGAIMNWDWVGPMETKVKIQDGLDGVAVSADGRRAVCVDNLKRLSFWDLENRHEMSRNDDSARGRNFVAISPDGRLALSDQADSGGRFEIPVAKRAVPGVGAAQSANGFRLWDVEDGREIKQFVGQKQPPSVLAFTTSGKRAVSASPDGTVRLWDLAAGKEIKVFSWQDDSAAPAAEGPGGIMPGGFAGGGKGGEMLMGGGLSPWPTKLAISPDGRHAVVGCRSGPLRWLTLLAEPPDLPYVPLPPPEKRLVSRREKMRFSGHSDKVLRVAFSADGKLVLSGSADKTMRLWDAATGKELKRFENRHSVIDVGFFADGFRLFSASEIESKIWDRATGQAVHSLGSARAIAMSPDNQWIVTSYLRDLRLWDAVSGKSKFLPAPLGQTMSLAFAPDGKSILSAMEDGGARLWAPMTGKEIRRYPGPRLVRAIFSPDGKNALFASHSGLAEGGFSPMKTTPSPLPESHSELRYLELASGKMGGGMMGGGMELQVIKAPRGGIAGLAISGDGKHALTGGLDKTMRLWDLQTGKEVRRFVGHAGEVLDVALSPDGGYALSASSDGIRLWELPEPVAAVPSGRKPIGPRRLQTFGGHKAAVLALAFTPDGRRLITASADRTSIVWDVASGQRTTHLEGRYYEGPVTTLAISSDGKRLATAEGRRLLPGPKGTSPFDPFDMPKGKLGKVPKTDLFAGRYLVMIHDLQSRRLHVELANSTPVHSLSFSADGKYLACAGDKNYAWIWGIKTRKKIFECRDPNKMPIQSVCFSPDGAWLATGGADHKIYLWKLPALAKALPFGDHGEAVRQVMFAPDSASLASVGETEVKLWNVVTKKLEKTWRPKGATIAAFAFRPDGQRIAVGDLEGNVRIWDPQSGRETSRQVHASAIRCLAYRPDGQALAIGVDNGQTFIIEANAK